MKLSSLAIVFSNAYDTNAFISFISSIMLTLNDIRTQLSDKASYLLDHKCIVPASQIHHPSPNIISEVFADSNRTPQVLKSIQSLYGHGRLANT